MSGLPEGWAVLPVSQVFTSIGSSKKKIKTKDAALVGSFPVIDQGARDVAGYSDDKSLLVSASQASPVILFGDHTRALKFVTCDFVPGADGTKLLQAGPMLNNRYAFHALRAIELPEKGYARHYQYLYNADLPIPPLSEQTRIADKLDTLLARVDAARERLDHVPTLLKRFRQSVLAAATSGELTEEWRGGKNADWREADVQFVAQVGTGSTPLRANKTFYAEQGTPWITSAATSERFVVGAEEFVTSDAIKAHRLKVYPAGTLLVAMYGEGKTRGQVTELAIPATINQACAAIQVDEGKADRRYVRFVLEANYYAMRELAEGGNQPNLNLTKVKEFPILIPSLDEQGEIIRRAEALFALADRVQAQYERARTRVDKFTPSLLAKAFRGELVPQNPNDEPASVLLERLRASKGSGPKPVKQDRKSSATVRKARKAS
ncbi:MAG: restriction endonuclease subunit S [Stenotrophomonas sp.]